MKTIKSAYIFTDLEGAAGIDDWDPRNVEYGSMAKGVYERTEMQRLLTGEVNAAAQGLFDAGVKDILINDAHGAGRTILVEDLLPGVRIARGLGRPLWLMGISKSIDAFFQVGMHAMAGTPNGCLAHTQSRGYIYRVNGQEVGEMEQAALLAGEMGIPWVFTAGDLHACKEAERWVPGIVTAPVKEGLGINCAVHLSPKDAQALIHARIQQAVAQAGEIKPLIMQAPFVMEVQSEKTWPAEIRAGAERVDAFTLRYTGPTFWSVFHHHSYGKPDIVIPN